MLRYLIKRTLLGLTTLFAVSVATFLLFFAVPTNPAEVMCGESKSCSAERIDEIEQRLGLDQPLVVQYGQFMSGVFVGRTYGEGDSARECPAPCLGYSFRSDEPVTDIVARTVPVTLSVVGGAAVVWLGIGLSLGMTSALRRGSWYDKTAIAISLTGAAMQVYFFGLILLIVFVYEFGVLPVPRYIPVTEDPLGWAGGLLLPWFALGFLSSAIYARLARAQMLETLSEDFIRTAQAKGLPKRTVYGRHALRAAATPLVTIAGLDIGNALGGTVITETVFGLNGLGRSAVRGVEYLDLPVVMVTVLLAAVFIVLANIVVDMLYAVIDPRVRLG
ncbi:MAG: ABC transporter permease [Micromonosporaceae bacterium]